MRANRGNSLFCKLFTQNSFATHFQSRKIFSLVLFFILASSSSLSAFAFTDSTTSIEQNEEISNTQISIREISSYKISVSEFFSLSTNGIESDEQNQQQPADVRKSKHIQIFIKEKWGLGDGDYNKRLALEKQNADKKAMNSV